MKINKRILSSYTQRGVLQLFLLQGLSMALVFIVNLVLVRIAGMEDYGTYVYIFNLLALLAGFSVMGLDTLLLKENAVHEHSHNYQKLKGVIHFAILFAVVGSLLTGIIAVVVINQMHLQAIIKIDHYYLIFLILLPLLSLGAVLQGSLQGLKKIIFSQVNEKVVRPLLMLIAISVFYFLKKKTDLPELIIIGGAAIFITLLITWILHARIVIPKIKNVIAKYETAYWIKSAFGFFLLNILVVMNSRVDIFLLGILGSNKEVGVYNIILKVSEVIGIALFIINFVISPLIPKMIITNEKEQLQKLVTQSARFVLLISVPVVLGIILFRHQVLGFFRVDLFGASKALVILCCGQLVNIMYGSVGILLLMSGNQKYSIISLSISVLLNITLNIILIPKFGIIGVSIAAAISLTAWNSLMYYFVRKKLNIYTTAFQHIKNYY
ncbi:MAG: polysaccharide biosynthesis C-terminal domain-containing protein [Flavitalea sp.]